MIGVRGGVDADEAVARRHPVHEGLPVGKGQIAGRVGEHDAVVSGKGLDAHLRREVGIGARVVHDESAGVLRKLVEHALGGGDGIVAKALGDRHHQHASWVVWPGGLEDKRRGHGHEGRGQKGDDGGRAHHVAFEPSSFTAR